MAPRRPGRKSPTEGKGKQKARDDTSHATHSSGSDRSRRSVAKSDHQPDSTSTHWTVQDEEALLELALMNQAMMGNGGNFRPAFWSEVAAKFPVPAHGKPKTVDSCKDKWKRMRTTYKIVHKIASTSGLAYSLERGADIGLESNDVWNGIVKNTKGVGQFKNKGWPHYEKMKQLVPSMSKGTYRFTAQEAPPTCPPAASGTPQPPSPSVLSPLPTTYQIHWQAQSGVAAVARPDIEMRPFQLPVVPANRLGSEPSQFIPPGPPSFPSPSSSVFRPPSVPSSHIGSAVSSIQPSSSVSVRFDHDSNKRKADDDVSMVSVTSGPVSVVSATGSGASTGSRKRRAPARSAAGNSDLSLSLRDGITTLQSSLHANQSLMDRMEIRSASRSLPAATAALGTSELTTTRTTDAKERKNVAKQLLIENDQDFLTMEQMLVIFDVFGEKRDYVNEYILLATLPASPPELRRGWLSKRLANLCRESHCAGSGD